MPTPRKKICVFCGKKMDKAEAEITLRNGKKLPACQACAVKKLNAFLKIMANFFKECKGGKK